MGSILLEIQETVMKYADIMSKIAGVEVEVVDQNLYRVAGTGIFREHVNEDMSAEGYVYEHLLRTGNMEIIYHPGKEKLCERCPKKDICREEIEISMPLRFENEIIGVIGLVGSSREQKERILANERMYLELLAQIGDFIVVKAAAVTELKEKEVLLDVLGCVVNHVEKGIMIFGNDQEIMMANDAARQQLGLKTVTGLQAVVTPTGDKLSRQNEYKMALKDKNYFLMGHLYDLDKDPEKYSKVLIFERTRDMQQRYYEITNTVNPLSTVHMIGSSPQTLQLQQEIGKIAKGTSTVLITGESGTGKELVATSIWKASDRKNQHFIAINCGAIPEPLLESELFGYVKGAFTGADPNGRMGKFELANKGVIFLDEIGDMPLYLQVKLLRVLQERKITRIGSNQVIPIDVRIIAATNKNLKEMMAKNQFREDLYYRLNVIPLRLSPLRERPEDIRELTYFFANRYASLFGKELNQIPEETMERLCSYPWYGNVRELENSVEFMIHMMEDDGILDFKTFPDSIREPVGESREQQERKRPTDEIRTLRELEQQEIIKALNLYGNDTDGKKKAAQKLGIGLATLYRKLEHV